MTSGPNKGFLTPVLGRIGFRLILSFFRSLAILGPNSSVLGLQDDFDCRERGWRDHHGLTGPSRGIQRKCQPAGPGPFLTLAATNWLTNSGRLTN
jgi:hypothetical protein